MKIVKKNFLLTTFIIFVVVTIVLSTLYFAMPVYYQQVKGGEAQRETQWDVDRRDDRQGREGGADAHGDHEADEEHDDRREDL